MGMSVWQPEDWHGDVKVHRIRGEGSVQHGLQSIHKLFFVTFLSFICLSVTAFVLVLKDTQWKLCTDVDFIFYLTEAHFFDNVFVTLSTSVQIAQDSLHL